LGREVLSKRIVQLKEETFFDIKKPKYNPKFWRLVGLYWHYHLRMKRSAKQERSKLNVLLKEFGREYAVKITRDRVRAWVNKSRSKQSSRGTPYNVGTINRWLAYLKAVYYNACDEDCDEGKRLERNPAARIDPIEGETIRQHLVNEYDFRRMYNAANPWFRPLLLAAWETGCRPEELYKTTWSNVDMIERVIYLPTNITKTGEARIIPMSERLFDEIKSLPKKSEYAFTNHIGGRYRDVRNEVQRIRERTGNNFWFRDMRKGFVTRKVSEGHDYFAIMSITGHRTTATFKRYNIGTLAQARKVVDSRPKSDGNKNDLSQICHTAETRAVSNYQ